MQIVDALAKLSFSFWQVVVLVAMVMFRKELKSIVRSITSLKVAGSEITWQPKSDAVEALTKLKTEVESADRTNSDIVHLIDAKIRNRLILALANLKRGTTYLWPALTEATPGSRISAPIRAQTLERIKSDLETLRGSGVAMYEIDFDADDPGGVHTFLIRVASAELCQLVAEVDETY